MIDRPTSPDAPIVISGHDMQLMRDTAVDARNIPRDTDRVVLDASNYLRFVALACRIAEEVEGVSQHAAEMTQRHDKIEDVLISLVGRLEGVYFPQDAETQAIVEEARDLLPLGDSQQQIMIQPGE